MRKTYTSLELTLALCVAIMTTAAIYGAIGCSHLRAESDGWHCLYTNSIYGWKQP